MFFKHESTYQGISSYTVYGDGVPYRIEQCFFVDRYDPHAGWNYTEEEYQRDVVDRIFYVSKYIGTITKECFLAFQESLKKDWEEWLAYCKRKREKYADDPEIVEIYHAYGPACPIAYPAYWDKGWNRLGY